MLSTQNAFCASRDRIAINDSTVKRSIHFDSQPLRFETDQPLDIMPGYYLCAGTLIGIIAAVDDVASNAQFLARFF
jgi:hypothetical protein